MFGHLVIKEWKERRALVVFAVVVLAGFAIASAAWAREREAPEILLGALSLVFLPVFGALLGSTGFEAEFRNGAWTYLLSRPIKKTTIWLAKFLALLSTLVLVGVLSFVVVSASPRLRAAASTLTAPGLGGPREPLISMLIVGFGLALLTFALAFAMSLLTERAITVTAVSLFLGFVIYGGWLYGFAAARNQFLWDLNLGVIWAGLLLTGLGVLLASLQTFRKADFSQPRRKAVFFWPRASVLFVLAVVIVALAAIWPPGVSPFAWPDCTDPGHAYIHTPRGYYVYSADEDRTEKLRLPVWGRYINLASARAGKLVGFEAGRRYGSFFIARTDGSDKVILTGPKAKDPRLKELWPMAGPLLSPDGKSVVFCTWPPRKRTKEKTFSELWLVNDRGDLVQHTAVVLPGFPDEDYSQTRIYLVGWPEGANKVLFGLGYRDQGKAPSVMVWDTDRNDLGVVAQDISLAPSHRPISGEILAVRRRSGDGTGWTLSLLDVKSASLTDIWTETNLKAEATGAHYTAVWSPDGQRLAFLVDRDNRPSVILGIYSWAEQKVISRRDLNRQDVRFTELIWTPDGREVVIRNRGRKGLEFFNVNLEPTHFASYPEGARFYGLNVVGDKLLTYDERNHRLWRLDLKTEQWRCIF